MDRKSETDGFQVCKAGELQPVDARKLWLIDTLWSREAVGIIAGPPKSAKTWTGLQLAISVASGRPLFGQFPVEQQGPALIYLAEDAPTVLRTRLDALCLHHQLDVGQLDLHVIVTPALRLDLDADQLRLSNTIDKVRPVFLLLDPLVRLHTLDENRSQDMAQLLGFVRQLQRTFHLAVALTHHQSKRTHAQPGKALRGSSDLWAWTDSALYLNRQQKHILLTVEHRAAPSPDPVTLNLMSLPDGTATHLELLSQESTPSLEHRLLTLLRQAPAPLPQNAIRQQLHVRNQRLGQLLERLEQQEKIVHSKNGWLFRCS